MIGIIFLIIATIFVYRTAKENGYNAILWSVITLITFLGVQTVVGLAVGIVIGIGMAAWNWSPTLFEDYTFPIGLISLIAGIGSVMLILRHVNTIRDDEPLVVPPPPDFNENN